MADRRKHGVRVLRTGPAPEGKLGWWSAATHRPICASILPGCGAAAAGCVMALLRFRRP